MLAKLLKQLKATGERENVTSILPIIMHQLPLPSLPPLLGLWCEWWERGGGGGRDQKRPPVLSDSDIWVSLPWSPELAEAWERLFQPLRVGGEEASASHPDLICLTLRRRQYWGWCAVCTPGGEKREEGPFWWVELSHDWSQIPHYRLHALPPSAAIISVCAHTCVPAVLSGWPFPGWFYLSWCRNSRNL